MNIQNNQQKKLEIKFRSKDSRKEELVETITITSTGILEDGKKIKLVQKHTNINRAIDLISTGKYFPTPSNQDIELSALEYVEHTIIPSAEKKEEAFGIESVWQTMIVNYLKEQGLAFVYGTLEKIKDQAFDGAVDLSDFILKELEKNIITKYNEAEERNKEWFKKKMQERFPNSEIIKQLN